MKTVKDAYVTQANKWIQSVELAILIDEEDIKHSHRHIELKKRLQKLNIEDVNLKKKALIKFKKQLSDYIANLNKKG